MRIVGMIVLSAVLVAGCANDDSDPPVDDDAAGGEAVSVDVEAAQRRYTEVCELIDGSGTDRCADLVSSAIDEAVDAGCSDLALEAYFEHGVAWRFSSLPEPGFFETCPTSLSTMVVSAPVEGFRVQGPEGYQVGVMTTDDVAADFADSEGVGSWLDAIGHELSYQSAWVADGSNSQVIAIRLDRFATSDGASEYTDPTLDPDPSSEPGFTSVTVPGVLDSRINTESLSGDDERPTYQSVALGRVCNVVITVHAMGDDEPIEVDLVREVFTQQARRSQVVVVC